MNHLEVTTNTQVGANIEPFDKFCKLIDRCAKLVNMSNVTHLRGLNHNAEIIFEWTAKHGLKTPNNMPDMRKGVWGSRQERLK